MPAPLGNNNGHRTNTWPAEHDEALKLYFAEGMSSSEIAAALNARFGWRTNYTRNAVIGRRIRMGIKSAIPQPKGRKKRTDTPVPKPWEAAGIGKRQYQRRRQAKRQGVSAAPKFIPYFERCDTPEPRNVALVELGPDDCRYPHGEADFRFCGHPRLAGSSYCPSHHYLTLRHP